ncbi:hypothetical protein DASC09_022990 [Saccharomycopsis crataegensis]|uniref:Enoyl-CoA hydratase/isomerase domain-containing protein n=1 Tax=Saccharomycopsis crataegensis TaxID=43959 RepID=A0AAV5QJR5_9ASCO|nr:hypothetical protein DASC09_022990 [Saccharomycopsis crataegensis]
MTLKSHIYQRYTHFKVTQCAPGVALVEINRPKQGNSFEHTTWIQFRDLLLQLNNEKDDNTVKVIILMGTGKHFCTGLNLKFAINHIGKLGLRAKRSRDGMASSSSSTRKKLIYQFIKEFQAAIATPTKIDIPIISVCHGVTYGLALDIMATTTVRYGTEGCKFAIPEIKLGFAADIGALQRLPHIITNHSLFNELVLTGESFDITTAKELGIVSKVFNTKAQAFTEALKLAVKISKFSRDSIAGTKNSLTSMAEGESVDTGLENVARYNSETLPVLKMPISKL